jgi:hypothetical protein
MDMSRCKVVIPPLLLVMIFIPALHLRYSDILDQFRSRYKDLDSATVDSVVADIKYHDSFQLVDHNKKPPKRGGPGASAVAVDRSGKEWTTPFEWLSSFSIKVVKTQWDRAIAGTGICPIHHRAEKPWHVPTNCPLLKHLNLKLVAGPPPHPAPAPANSPTPVSAPVSTTPGGVLLLRMIPPRILLLRVSWRLWRKRTTTLIWNFVGLGMRTVFFTLLIPILVNLTTALFPTRLVLMRQLYQPLFPPFHRWDRPLRRPLHPTVFLWSMIQLHLRQFLLPLTPFSPGCLNVQLLLVWAVVLPLLTLVLRIICIPTNPPLFPTRPHQT